LTARGESVARRFGECLLDWYDRQHRDLPWRRTRDPWAIWVSEVMLQQTRVEVVRDAWSRFVAKFPRPADFAVASDDELQAAWRGLGYYRRAKLLRAGAQAVVREHRGEVPATANELGELPGIGVYTRGAIASIAFGHRELAIDGNVERVVARHRGIEVNVKARAAAQAIGGFVAECQDPARPGDFNQALMELGATVCVPRTPACDRCPVQRDCVAATTGRQRELPVLPARPSPVRIEARAILAFARGAALGHRLPDGVINAGQIELPGPGVLVSCDPAELAERLRADFACEAQIAAPVASIKHTITRHRITLHAHAAQVRRRGRLQPFAMHDPAVPWTTAARKVFAQLGGTGAAEDR
jgi:A/G-specific adenine glycosylase